MRGTWPPRIGPLTLPPTFAVSPLGTENRVLAHPRNRPSPSQALAPRWGDFPLARTGFAGQVEGPRIEIGRVGAERGDGRF